jgi:isochorismate hydrolase
MERHPDRAMTDLLERIAGYNIRLQHPAPESAALLVIDMQQYFKALAEPIAANVAALIQACRESGIPVIHTRHGHRDPEQDGGMLARWWGDSIMVKTRDWEWIRGVAPHKTDTVIDKQRYSAFSGTPLAERLEALEVEQLIIAGVMSNCCCETTAREAFVRDFRVFFMADATATVNEELHLATLKNLAFSCAHVVGTAALCRHLAGSRRS